MAAVVVVMMMLGGFLSTQRAHLSLSASNTNRQLCRDAVESLAEFCRFKLEEDDAWLRVSENYAERSFPEGSPNPSLKLRELSPEEIDSRDDLEALDGRTYVEGKVVDTDVRFVIGVVNNLDNRLADPLHQVAPESCRLRIRAFNGRASTVVEVILRKAAYFSSTVASSGDITLDGDEVVFESTDPLRNQIRSLSNIKLPDTPHITFRPDEGTQRAEKGTIWARGDIEVDEDSSAAKLAEVTAATDGEFIPNARTAYSVPEIVKEDIETQLEEPLEIRPAIYNFGSTEVEFEDTAGVTHTKSVPAVYEIIPGLEPEFNTLGTVHYMPTAVEDPNDPFTPDLDTVRLASDHPATPHASPVFTPEDGPEIDMAGMTVTLPADTEIVVRGSFGVGGGDPQFLPSLVFHDPDPLLPDPNSPDRGHLEVERDLGLSCQIVNGGKLIAERDIHLTPKEAELDSNETEDLAVFAGNDVVIRPLFTNDESYLERNAKFTFRGLVYAQNDFKFLSRAKKGDDTATYNRRLEIEGALVARNGSVEVTGQEEVILRYNPDFLDDVLEKNFELKKAQIEAVSQRPL